MTIETIIKETEQPIINTINGASHPNFQSDAAESFRIKALNIAVKIELLRSITEHVKQISDAQQHILQQHIDFGFWLKDSEADIIAHLVEEDDAQGYNQGRMNWYSSNKVRITDIDTDKGDIVHLYGDRYNVLSRDPRVNPSGEHFGYAGSWSGGREALDWVNIASEAKASILENVHNQNVFTCSVLDSIIEQLNMIVPVSEILESGNVPFVPNDPALILGKYDINDSDLEKIDENLKKFLSAPSDGSTVFERMKDMNQGKVSAPVEDSGVENKGSSGAVNGGVSGGFTGGGFADGGFSTPSLSGAGGAGINPIGKLPEPPVFDDSWEEGLADVDELIEKFNDVNAETVTDVIEDEFVASFDMVEPNTLISKVNADTGDVSTVKIPDKAVVFYDKEANPVAFWDEENNVIYRGVTGEDLESGSVRGVGRVNASEKEIGLLFDEFYDRDGSRMVREAGSEDVVSDTSDEVPSESGVGDESDVSETSRTAGTGDDGLEDSEQETTTPVTPSVTKYKTSHYTSTSDDPVQVDAIASSISMPKAPTAN